VLKKSYDVNRQADGGVRSASAAFFALQTALEPSQD
jgi:hypothetical protein